MTTWDDIRLATLKKIFLADGDSIDENDSTRQYLSSMPNAYNEAVNLLATNNRYVTKTYDVDSDGLTPYIVIELREAIPDMYQFKSDGILFIGDDGSMEVVENYQYMANAYLYLKGTKVGTYRIVYYAYPLQASADTPGDTDMQLDNDVASVVPLYMASQLYKDDDISIATIYRNEFELARESMDRERMKKVNEKFRSVGGWF